MTIGKVSAIIVLISTIIGILANIAGITEFVLKMRDRYGPGSAQTSEVSEEEPGKKQTDDIKRNVYSIDENGKITFVQGTEIVLRVKNNEGLVTTDSRGYLQGKGSEINSDSIYQIHNTPDDYSGLQGVYGFVRVAADEDNAPVYENADEIQSWECFEFFKHNEYVYIKSQANDKYITCVLDEEGDRLCARGEEVQEWELFSVYIRDKKKWKNIFTDEKMEF